MTTISMPDEIIPPDLSPRWVIAYQQTEVTIDGRHLITTRWLAREPLRLPPGHFRWLLTLLLPEAHRFTTYEEAQNTHPFRNMDRLIMQITDSGTLTVA